MLLDQYQTKEITIKVIELLKQRFAKPFSPLFILPNLLMDSEALANITSLGFYHWKIKGVHSAGINLAISKDELRNQLKSKWRNN